MPMFSLSEGPQQSAPTAVALAAAAPAAEAVTCTRVDNTSDHDSWWDATCVGALLRPFGPGKLCRRSTRREKRFLVWISLLTAEKHGGGCSMEGDGLRAEGETMDG